MSCYIARALKWLPLQIAEYVQPYYRAKKKQKTAAILQCVETRNNTLHLTDPVLQMASLIINLLTDDIP